MKKKNTERKTGDEKRDEKKETPKLRLVALTREQSVIQRLREDTLGKQLSHVPFGSAFSLPGPEHPATLLLPGVQLTFDEATGVLLILVGEIGHSTNRLSCAVTDLEVGRHGTVIASAHSLAVEVFGTVGHGTGPFTHDSPFVRLLELPGAVRADVLDMHVDVLCEKSIVENFIVMVVHNNVVLGQEAVPTVDGVEAIVQDQGRSCIRLMCSLLEVAVVLAQKAPVNTSGNTGFIESLKQHMGVFSVSINQALNCGGCPVNCVSLLPLDRTPAAAVVKSVLRARS